METTYKIIGADGIEYGPVALSELKFWVTDGRVAGQTQVWRSDSARWMPACSYPELQPELGETAPPSPGATSELGPVGFWPRIGAYLIDGLLLNVIFYLIMGPSTFKLDPSAMPDLETMFRMLQPALAVTLLVQMIYNVALNGQFGATVGKMAIGAQIVNPDGSRIGFGKAFLRWLGTLVTQLTFGIGYLMVAFREDKRALHDLLARTQVVYRR